MVILVYEIQEEPLLTQGVKSYNLRLKWETYI